MGACGSAPTGVPLILAVRLLTSLLRLARGGVPIGADRDPFPHSIFQKFHAFPKFWAGPEWMLRHNDFLASCRSVVNPLGSILSVGVSSSRRRDRCDGIPITRVWLTKPVLDRLTLAARLVQLGFGDHTFDFDLDPLHRSSSRIRRIGLPPSLGVASTLGRKAPMLVSNVPR